MEISAASKSVFYMAKFLGLAPFATYKNEKSVPIIKRSLILTVYSIAIISVFVFLICRGLLFDVDGKMPVQVRSATSKVVTILDVSVVVLGTTAGACCGLFGIKSTRGLNERLQQVDKCVDSPVHFKRDRLFGLLMLLPMLFIMSLLVFDFTTWLRFAARLNVKLNVQWYIPFYALYIILTGVHVVFATTAFGLGRRYRRLNAMLRRSLLLDAQHPTSQNNPKMKHKVQPVQAILTISALGDSLTKLKAQAQNLDASTNKAKLIRVLAEHHSSLNECMAILSGAYGIAVLFILISCLLHLVATSYFLFLQFLTENDGGYMWLQILWISFHTFRLLLVVQPCHIAAIESKRTMQIVCEIERKISDPILLEEIKKFWQQLLVLNSDFSACGLCNVNRNILTSIGSAIATYLVILIQFQKTNG